MLITIAILIYLVFGIFDAMTFKLENQHANAFWLVLAVLLTPAVRLTAVIVANWMLAIIIGLIIYIINR